MTERTRPVIHDAPTVADFTMTFSGDYIGIEQLRDGKKGIYVNQGYASTSHDGTILDSEGFSSCSALIVQDAESEVAYLAHVSEWELRDEQFQILDELPEGRYRATFVLGTDSRRVSSIWRNETKSPFLHRANTNKQVEISDDVVVDSGEYHWGVSYDPATRTLKVFTRRNHQVSEYGLKER